MTPLYYNDLDVYFHMKNHFRMLRNVKSRVDTSSPRSWARETSPAAMSQSEKAIRKRSVQDIRKRFKNVLNFTKKTKNNPPAPSSPIANSARYKDISAETMHVESNVPKEMYHSHHPCLAVQAFPIRSTYASKDPSLCRHTCLHHKPSVSKSVTSEKRMTLNNQCQHTCFKHTPKKNHMEQNTIKSHFKSKHHIETETQRNHNSESRSLADNKYIFSKYEYHESKARVEPSCGDMARSKTNINENFEVKNNADCANVFALEKDQSGGECDGTSLSDKIDSKIEAGKTITQRSSKEQEYLMFLLRITEDIIVNDFYANDDIKNIFERHIEKNKTHLDYKRMLYHISNLCRELNINCDNYSNFEFQNQFESHRELKCVFDRSIFRNCTRCANLPMMPKFITNKNEDEFENQISIIPEALEVTEKLSLGRVTECSEPIPSTSTLNTLKMIDIDALPKVEKLKNIEKVYEHEDDSCFKGQKLIYENEINKSGNSSSSYKASSQTLKINSKTEKLVKQTFEVNALDTNDKQSIDFYINLDYQEHTSSLENSENSFQISSKRPKQEFRELSLDEVWSNTKSLLNKANINKEDNECTNDEKLDSKTHIRNTISTIEYYSEKPNQSENMLSQQNNVIEYYSKSTNQSEDQSENMLSQHNKVTKQDLASSKNQESEYNIETDFLQSEYEEAKNIEANITSILKELTAKTIKECEQKNNVIDIFRASQQNIDKLSPDSDSSKSECQNRILPFIESIRKNTKAVIISKEQENSIRKDKRECTIKVCIEGSPKESDYIYLKGPVYVLKALLNVQPQLIILQEELDNELNKNNRLTRHESTDSLDSNKTFTITNPTTEEFDIKFDEQVGVDVQDIPSDHKNVISEDSLCKQFAKNIEFLKKPSGTYNLSYSDYDLTPERECTNKYHNLLVDVTTSMPTISPLKKLNCNSQLTEKLETESPKYDSELENIRNIKPDQVILLTEHYEELYKNTVLDENVTSESDQNCQIVFDTVLNELRSKCGSFHKLHEVETVSSSETRKFLNKDKQGEENTAVETLAGNGKYMTKVEQEFTNKKSDLSDLIYKDTSNKLLMFAKRLTDFQDNSKEIYARQNDSENNQKSVINVNVSNTDGCDNSGWEILLSTDVTTILNSPHTMNDQHKHLAKNSNSEYLIDRLEITGSNQLDNGDHLHNLNIQSKDQDVLSFTELKENESINQTTDSELKVCQNDNIKPETSIANKDVGISQSNSKDDIKILRNMKDEIEKINDEVESTLKGNSYTVEADGIQNNIETEDRLKISKSENNLSKLFRFHIAPCNEDNWLWNNPWQCELFLEYQAVFQAESSCSGTPFRKTLFQMQMDPLQNFILTV